MINYIASFQHYWQNDLLLTSAYWYLACIDVKTCILVLLIKFLSWNSKPPILNNKGLKHWVVQTSFNLSKLHSTHNYDVLLNISQLLLWEQSLSIFFRTQQRAGLQLIAELYVKIGFNTYCDFIIRQAIVNKVIVVFFTFYWWN